MLKLLNVSLFPGLWKYFFNIEPKAWILASQDGTTVAVEKTAVAMILQ